MLCCFFGACFCFAKVYTCHRCLGIPNISSSFGTAPDVWNLMFGRLALSQETFLCLPSLGSHPHRSPTSECPKKLLSADMTYGCKPFGAWVLMALQRWPRRGLLGLSLSKLSMMKSLSHPSLTVACRTKASRTRPKPLERKPPWPRRCPLPSEVSSRERRGQTSFNHAGSATWGSYGLEFTALQAASADWGCKRFSLEVLVGLDG